MYAPPQNRAFLGVGWRFPLQVTPNGRIAQARHEQRIEEAIVIILSTAPGERPMLPEFGCGIHNTLFAPNDSRTIALVVHQVRQALTRHEARIDVLDVHAENNLDAPNLLLIRINYRVRETNAIGNLVYPFYIREDR
ncbi:phage baseplate assembly protein W [Duganella sp. 1411]|jgi:phage baseplate assembly protein W|uniref:GPW/gp25 family protein n=1 Tax=Duganella sp. 1411 TaxID=2806572 RepID=UPI001AE873BB|nr:GPW/gp25 family protein [Duganella sp. 1411]MBP1202423.1 phage baseplate assembly protein W [Duganella sp. 1411]